MERKEWVRKRKESRRHKKEIKRAVKHRIKTGRFDCAYTIELLEALKKRNGKFTPQELNFYNKELERDYYDLLDGNASTGFVFGLHNPFKRNGFINRP